MSDITGLNMFGSLTTSTGKKVEFKDFDADGDGKITEEEWTQGLKDFGLDEIELSNVDKNEDKTISEDEFKVLEQKQEMQKSLNSLAGTISIDFAGKSQYITELTTKLKELVDSFADSYTGNVEDMAKDFNSQLTTLYTGVKDEVLANDSDTITTNVINAMVKEFQANGYTTSQIKTIAKQLETMSNSYVSKYTGSDLGTDLANYLSTMLTTSSKTRSSSAVDAYNTNIAKFGDTIESTELEGVKETVRQFLTELLNTGISLSLGGNTISLTNLEAVLKKYTDGETLKTDVQTLIDSMSDEAPITQLLNEQSLSEFQSITGSSYQIDASIIDYSQIEGYSDGSSIYERGHGFSGSKDKAVAKGTEMLNDDSVKSQIKAQIQSMLEAKGISFDQIETVFENVYAETINQTLEQDGMVTGRGARGLSSKGKAYINIKDMVDSFITNFNTNIASAIDEMNKSNTDMDLIDIDYTVLNTNDDGSAIGENGEDFTALYRTGNTTTVEKQGTDYYNSIAEQLVDRLKSQMLTKAKAMCTANGVKFDESVFTSIFNNAKSLAVASAVTGEGARNSGSLTGTEKTLASSIGGGVGAGAGTAAGLTNFLGIGTTVGAGIATGGIVAAAALGVGFVTGLLTGGHHSSSTLDTQGLINTFTSEFKTNYSNWIENQKAKDKQ
jgi:hypothetical protein